MAASTGARLQRKAARTAVSAAPDPSIRRCYGSCYRSKTFRAGCKRLGLRQIFTKPYTPRTNGKAERFIQTSLREWADARAYNTSDERTAELPRWLHRYNWHSASWQYRLKTANEPPRSGPEQPIEAPQLSRFADH